MHKPCLSQSGTRGASGFVVRAGLRIAPALGEKIVLHRFTAPWLDQSNFTLDWNGPADRAFAAIDDLSRPIAEHFRDAAEKHPDRIAIADEKTAVTYREALATVTTLAAHLAVETAPGELIGILLPASVEFPLVMLACLAAGRLFVPLDLHYPPAWLASVMRDSKMAAVIGRLGDAECNDVVPEGVRKIDLARCLASPACGGGGAPTSGVTAASAKAKACLGDDTRHAQAARRRREGASTASPAIVLFTSGSTGKPKGIVNSQRALLRRVSQYVDAAHINENDCFLPLSSECTIAGLRERLTALLTGATLQVIDVQRAGARAILNRLHDADVTMLYAVPALLRSLMQLGDAKAPASLRVVRVGGDAVLWSDIDALRAWLPDECRIELGYSSTEAPIMQWFVPGNFAQEGSKVPLGYPLAGNSLAIVDEDGNAVAPGETGELIVRSPYIALGRWNDGRCDGGDFPVDPKDPSCRILRTGDLVRLNANGLIDLIGRKDRQLKIRGQRVEPGELEAAIRRQPGIRDAAVFPRRVGQQWWLIAYVVGDADPAALKTALRNTLPPALQPQRIHTLDAIPRLASAKLDMAALAALDEDWQLREVTSATSATETPIGETEQAVAAIWRRVLARDDIGRDDDFFDLGGDSLSTLALMFGIEEALGRELPVTMIYEAPTIAALAAAIDAHAAPCFSPLVKIKDGEGAPLFIVHGVGGNVMELFAVGRRLEGPVYAIQARGLDGKEAPNRSIAAMADDYLAAIRTAFPQGPYHLAGYSSGGLTALEIARRLWAQGETPASLTLIDTQTHASQWPLSVRAEQFVRRLRHHTMRGALAARLGFKPAAVSAAGPLNFPPALQAVYDATLSAIAQYHPARYDGPVHLILAQDADPLMASPARIWQGRCAALTCHTVPGDHRSMVQGGNAAGLAEVVTRIVRG